MKATFNDFLKTNPNCSGFEQIADAYAIFDFLSNDEVIIKMIDSVENKKPALAGCVNELETYYETLQSREIDLMDNFTRTVIGRMVKAILNPFGYIPTVQKSFPKSNRPKYFRSASCYEKNGIASMQVVKRIEPVK